MSARPLAGQAVEMLAPVAVEARSAQLMPEQEIGAGLATGEMPQAQACVLYMLRTGVIDQLGEAAQRRLLERCAIQGLGFSAPLGGWARPRSGGCSGGTPARGALT